MGNIRLNAFFFSHHPTNRLDNTYILYVCQKKLFLGRKIMEGHLPHPPLGRQVTRMTLTINVTQ